MTRTTGSIIEHLSDVDRLVEERAEKERANLLYQMGGGDSHGGGMGLSGGGDFVPWGHNTPWAGTRDTDHDGIIDALDHYFGPGAHNPYH